MIQQSHSWPYIQRKPQFKKTHAPQCSKQHYLQQPGHGSNLHVSTEEWIKKMWYIYTMEYYSAIKRNEIGSFVETWMDLESAIQSKVSQKEKSKYHIKMHKCGIQKNGIDDLYQDKIHQVRLPNNPINLSSTKITVTVKKRIWRL